MHFEILIEDQSGKKALDIIVPKIIGNEHTFKVVAYKGIGRIPRKMTSNVDASKRILLENLPRILKGYGNSWKNYPAVLFVVCDLDKKCLKDFRQQLLNILNQCNPKPETRFCIAIEEGEAWFLGDLQAVKNAYPKAVDSFLDSYRNDSICSTWEKLADAIYQGGASELLSKGWQFIGKVKSEWAEKIAPAMNVKNNSSPSFNYFRSKLLDLTGSELY